MSAPKAAVMSAALFSVVGFVVGSSAGSAIRSARADGKIYTVRIENMKFVPGQITAEAGDTVIWENHDRVSHIVHRRDGGDPALDSGSIGPGRTFSFRVRGASSIPYECLLFPKMHGTIDIIDKD